MCVGEVLVQATNVVQKYKGHQSINQIHASGDIHTRKHVSMRVCWCVCVCVQLTSSTV